ncbi:voltage-dependent p/q type calcium channel [Culex quinquefasciatus]|uniref:Voltage-dependent p/q type calcium channel n=1 Tax=Culex quinquefasciatus TaxID=7176 RepID=B0XES3_CULQU|nr:voltage-dependent p/q type calcium channel [Culex quinquefasciatus]|eukprot:XP_001868145.1 voltage-dependent p/q type calcium channel [Culex quinquefasciatus]
MAYGDGLRGSEADSVCVNSVLVIACPASRHIDVSRWIAAANYKLATQYLSYSDQQLERLGKT